MKKFRKLQNKGFTLIEIIIVLLILSILAAIAIPSMIGYVQEARESEDYQYVGLLNRASSGYKAIVYKNNGKITDGDIFYGVNSDKAREEILLQNNLIDEIYISKKTKTYFHWDIDTQKWVVEGKSVASKDGTILDDLINGNPMGNWKNDKEYYYNDLVEVIENGVTVTYKCIAKKGNEAGTCEIGKGPEHLSSQRYDAWKRVDLAYNSSNVYEKGDIVKHDGKYYRALLANPSSYPGPNYHSPEDYDHYFDGPRFELVEKDSDGNWLKK